MKTVGIKIKVLRIIARLNIGGPAIHAILLTEGLDNNRFESVLVTGTPGPGEGNMAYLAQEKGVLPIIIPELGPSLSLSHDWVAFWKLFQLIKQERPDIIHTHTAKAGTLGRLAGLLYNLLSVFCFLFFGRRKKCKLIHTFHGHVLQGYFGKIKSIVFIWIERVLALFTDKIVAVSENLKKELLKLRIGDSAKIITLPLGLELEKFLKIDNNFQSKNYRSIGIVGRLVPIKNHEMFLSAAKMILDIGGSSQKIRFLIVGDGILRPELEKYAQTLGITENLEFAGWKENLANVYSQLDIVALTSLNEGTPVALIEALAAARPCVATEVGGVKDVIIQGKSGFLVPSGDVDNFSNSIIELLSNPQLMRSMGEYGRNDVKDRFDKKRLIKDIENLYAGELTKGAAQ